MKHTMTKWLSAIALISCVACSKVEIDTEKAVNTNEKGVFGYLTPFVDEDAGTRGNVLPDESWKYVWEVGDKINIWSDEGTTLFYSVSETSGDRATFTGGGFTLDEGATYYSFHPRILSEEYQALPISFMGQTQNGNNNGKHLADYTYSYTSAVCTNGNTSFQYHNLVMYVRLVVTLPKSGMTVNKLTLTADKSVFAQNGTVNVPTGAFTPGTMSDTFTLTLNNATVSDNVLKAFIASNPWPETANYVVTVEDSEGKIYTSEPIEKPAYTVGKVAKIAVTVESVERNYELVTSMPSDPAGKYILVYPNGTTYRAFSFAKTMENAETAAASVSDVAFADLYDQASNLYNAVVGGNYVEITGEANATTLVLNPEQEAAAALDIAANAAPWTVTAPAKDLQTTLTSGSYSMGVDHLVVDVASDGKADLVAAFNAPDAVAVMNSLRGHDVNVTFQDLINLAITKNDEFTDDEAVIFTKAFNKLVAVVKKVVAENPHNLFPAGSTLMNITLNTNAFEVFSQYHDNVAELSWRISPEKRFGLAQLGYNVNAQGFTVSVNLPSHEWFNKLNESLTSSAVGIFPSRDKFVAYWAALDSQYTVSLDGVKIDDFFKKLATRFVAELRQGTSAFDSSDEFTQLYAAAVLEEFTKMGNAYKKLAEKLNTGIQPAYIYKKVE